MSELFSSSKIGQVEIKNRFVHSAIYEGMAAPNGEVTEKLIKYYENLSTGGVGLIISGMTFINQLGKSTKYQMGIHVDSMISGLKRIVDVIHENGSKIIFQINHAGRQTNRNYCGGTPISPSSKGRDMVFFVKPRKMNEEDIESVILDFGQAARRAIEAGADGVQIHGAHGYLINQFLSPYFNVRKDKWGGSDENRFQFLKKVINEVRTFVPQDKILAVKMGINEIAGKNGIQIDLIKKYAEWVSGYVDAIEISAGSTLFMFPNLIRGEIPINEMLRLYPRIMSPLVRIVLKKMAKGREFSDLYNLKTAIAVRPKINNTKLILVGGIRKIEDMNKVLDNNYADFLSFGRPFINNPHFVNQLQEGRENPIKCINCNKCFVAVGLDYEVMCYKNGIPR